MAIPYPYTSSQDNHISTGSYLNQKETNMFVSDYTSDIWYGFSETDVIELSVFDLDQNPIGWDTINTEKNYRNVSLTYFNTLDQQISYSYNELLTDFILYKNFNILVNPIEQLSSSFSIISGSYLVSYNFIREMAGNASASLVVKDISPSRKELKIVPAAGNTPRYEAFCRKKFQVKDVAPLLIQLTNQCPYSQIYAEVKDQNVKDISFLKQLLFLNTDGEFVTFLKSLYEDVIVYTTPPATLPLETVKRTQGIRGYYQNFLLSNYETITDFIEIDDNYDSFAAARVEQLFKPYGPQTGDDFVSAKKFLVDFFTTNFYHKITTSVKASFDAKYYSYLKNALNIGDNQMFLILDHSYIDERASESDPLTLLLKLKSELPEEVKIQTGCWISNVSLAPFVVNAILRPPASGRTITISPPNFALEKNTISLYNSNQSYTATDLRNTSGDQQTIDINKKINELQVDYTDFSNFIVFSSAQHRVANFKTKISSWYTLSASVVDLDFVASQSLSNGSLYPRYALERNTLTGQMEEIVSSFDGYESYLFNTGSYVYDPSTKAFVNASYVEDQDSTSTDYDKDNRDSLINNTPQHIVLDDRNDDYLTFLNMIGHFFDNIYLYITNLPSEKVVQNDPTKTFSKQMVDYMLNSFGWDLGTTYEDMTALQTYSTSVSSSMSEEDRTKAIRTRVLGTLPQIYKTKGTSEAIRLLIACYGIPSSLLEIREYGHNDYASSSLVTYTKIEQSCLFGFSGSNAGITQHYTLKPAVRTVEFKLAVNHPEEYSRKVRVPVVTETNDFIDLSSVYSTLKTWEIGFWKEYGKMGVVYAFLGTGSYSLGQSTVLLTSSLIPILDGDIFNIMLRRNDPDPYFQYSSDIELVPTKYDLVVQRNVAGRRVFRSIDTELGFYADNLIWDGITPDTSFLSSTDTASINWLNTSSNQNVYLEIGNAMVWDVPISDSDFETHCNDFSSFAYSGSYPERHLIARMDADEPTDFISASLSSSWGAPVTASGYIPNRSEYYSTYHDLYGDYIISASYTGSSTALYGKSPMPYSFVYVNYGYFPLNVSLSFNTASCTYVSSSVYPFEYVVKNLEKTYTTPSYGPNRFRNEKVNVREQNLDVRVDDKDRSTYEMNTDVESDSNLLGLYLDPQDAKNRDIVKYHGSNDIIGLIADPANMYSASYTDLQALNQEYNSFGDRRVLYNELITLYKIYFNRSMFDVVNNIIPARANVRTGIVVEPTVLERPKYQHRPINTEMNVNSVAYYDVTASLYAKNLLSSSVYPNDTITKLVRFSGSVGNSSAGKLGLLWGEFNIDLSYTLSNFDASTLPSNPTMNLDVSYINEANFIYPVNYNDGYYPDLMDDLQFGNYGSLGDYPGHLGVFGVTHQLDLNKHTHPSGSEEYYIAKKWSKYTVYAKSGSYVRDSIKKDDVYSSNSIWLYSLVGMSRGGYTQYFYVSNTYEPSGSVWDLTPTIGNIGGVPVYMHFINTARRTSNQSINTIKATDIHAGTAVYAGAPFYDVATDTYFEVFRGYPRNHYTHKRMQFSPTRFLSITGRFKVQTSQMYTKSRQTVDTTIDNESLLEDASDPVQSIQTSNVNLVKSDNVINQ